MIRQNMEISAASDSELLAAWVAHRRESAFHALVARYATLVHMAAKRTCGDDALAADASQLVFILLAQKAKSLTRHPALAGWLHVTAVNTTRDLIDKARRESRKRRHLGTAMETSSSNPSADAWQELQPVLDDALASLSEKDREALLLRFYRSLTVREIAATLGIATDAAQKRIDRATERLRGKLVRRGCQAGGSLGAAMVAGFAADSQAAIPSVSLMTSKAVAAGTGTSGFLTNLAAVLAMKTFLFVSPVLILILAGAWIGSQRQTIHALDRRNALLESAISGHLILGAADAGPSKLQAAAPPGKQQAALDWSELADRLANAGFNDVDQLMIDQQIGSMSAEKMLAALDEIALLAIPQKIKEQLEGMVVFPLSKKFPEVAVTRLTNRDRRLAGIFIDYLGGSMEAWARKDFSAASAWMDAEISSGSFDSKALNGKNLLQIQYESALIRTLLTRDGDLLAQRLNQVREAWRTDVIMGIATMWRANGKFEPADEVAFGKLVREQLSPTDQMNAIVARASQASAGGFPAVDQFLELIEAAPEERLRCVGQVAESALAGISLNRVVTREDIVGLREWVGTQVPEAVDRFTGEALGDSVMQKGIAPTNYRKMSYPEAAAWVVDFNEAGGRNAVLTSFLRSEGGRSDKVQARSLAGRISDEALRAEILKTLE